MVHPFLTEENMEFITIGRAINTHGLKGELKIESWSDFDELRYRKGNTVYLLQNDTYTPFIVATFRTHKGYSLVSFEDYQDINRIESFKGSLVCIRREDQQALPEGEFYRSQLIGLRVYDETGTLIGTVVSVEETSGAQNNLRVEREGMKDALIPNIPVFVKQVDLSSGRIVIHAEEGLL